MKRRHALAATLALTCAAAVAPAASATAVGKDEAPAQVCKNNNNTFMDDDRPFPFVIQSKGGCASSVAQGFPESYVLTGAAFNSQCKFLEAGVDEPGFVFKLEYPYAFYDNPAYVAKNRADCKYFLSAFHFGLLPPGPG